MDGVDPLGLDSYVFFDPELYQGQAASLKNILDNRYGTPTHLVPIQTSVEFTEKWRSMKDSPEEIAMIFHGKPASLWALGGFILSSQKSGIKIQNGHPGISAMTLSGKNARKISFYSCNSGTVPSTSRDAEHFSVKEFQDISLVGAMSLSQGNSKITGFKGNVSFASPVNALSTLAWRPWFDFSPRLSTFQTVDSPPTALQGLETFDPSVHVSGYIESIKATK